MGGDGLRRTRFYALVGVAGATILVSALALSGLQNIEISITSSMTRLIAGLSPNLQDAGLHQQRCVLVRAMLITLFATAAVLAGYRLTGGPRLLVLLQLSALSLILNLLFLAVNLPLYATATLIIACLVGTASGALIGTLRIHEERIESQNHQLEAITRELIESKVQIIRDDEVERRMLAADLHDQVLNDLKFLRQKIDDSSQEFSDSLREDLDRLLSSSMKHTREVMDSLSPAVLDHLGFVDAVEDLIRSGAKRGGFRVRFRRGTEPDAFDRFNKIELTLLYRLIQESVNNICKHAGASKVTGCISEDLDALEISITDDGAGFSPQSGHDSRGLRYMRQRASILGATVTWLAGAEGRGTKVTITIPKRIQGD